MAGTASLLVIQMFWLWPLDLPPLSMGLLPNIQQFVVSNLQTMAIFAFIVGCAYVSLFSDDIEVLHSIVNFLQNKIEKNDNTGDSEENTASSYRSEEGISSSSTDEGICSTISGMCCVYHSVGQKIKKKVQTKKLVKSYKSISQKNFFFKFHFLQFQKWPKINF